MNYGTSINNTTNGIVEGLPSLRPTLSAETLYRVFFNDPSVGSAIVSVDGVFLDASPRFATLYTGISDPAALIGQSLASLFPEPWAQERKEWLRQVGAAGRRFAVEHIKRGARVLTVVNPLECEQNYPIFLLTVTEIFDREVRLPPDIDLYVASTADLGNLAVLSPRELEVLALVGEGLTTAEIAGRLYRSPKTIDKHRESIAQKLGARNRADLIIVARRAGLKPDDARATRVDTLR